MCITLFIPLFLGAMAQRAAAGADGELKECEGSCSKSGCPLAKSVCQGCVVGEVSPHTYICVPTLRLIYYVSPHTTVYASSSCVVGEESPHTYICVPIHLASSYYYYIFVLILLLHMCPHTTIYVSAYCVVGYMCVPCYSSYYYLCALILLRMCPPTTIYVFSYRASSNGTAGL